MEQQSQNIELEELIRNLIEYDDSYAIGEPLIPDALYDNLRDEAEAMAPLHPYFKTVGSMVRGGKIKLPYTMGSLDQPKEQSGLDNWIKRFNLQSSVLIASHKLDGISCTLHYNYGKLQQAFSRGDGIEGADITRHVVNIPNVPKTIPFKGSLHSRHEIIMKDSTFTEKYASEYKNARNLVAGAMNRSTTSNNLLADIDVIAYDIINIDDDSLELTKVNALELFNSWGFNTVHYQKILSSHMTVEFLSEILKSFKLASEYTLDGAVITNNDYLNTGERKSQTLNPTHSIKFKTLEEDSIVEATVVDVHWEISKSRYCKPRVEISPVELFGTTVRFATGFNGKYITDNKIGKGTILRITKSGSVIPYIVEIIKPTYAMLPDYEWEWNDSGVEMLVDENHPTVLFKQCLSFFISLDVELLKEASLKKMFTEYELWGDDFFRVCEVLFDLIPNEWDATLGVNGTKIHESLHRRLSNITPATLIGSLPFMGIGFGIRKATQLLSQVGDGDISELTDLSENEIMACDGFDRITAKKVVDNIPQVLEFLEKFNDYIEFGKSETTSEMADVVVVMTGFRDKDLKFKIESMGGRVTSAVSKKTTHLLTIDTKSTSGKAKKARDLGVNIMRPVDFKDYFNI